MSEDEVKEKLKELVTRCKECKFATCENCEINWNEVQAIETILDLCQKEKEKNNKIQKYVRSNEWAKDYKKSSCRTKILRILEE